MTASTEKPTTKNSSRRALLAGALGGIGAVAAGAVAKVSPVRAEGEAIVVGGEYTTATSRTRLRNESNNQNVFAAESAASGIGVWGESSGSAGVYGTSSSSIGVYGVSSSDTGVRGVSGTSYGVVASSTTSIGMHGYSSAADQPAVRAQSFGHSSGLLAYSGTGTAPAPKPKTGVYGYANQDSGSKGVWGFSGQGVGVYGKANKNGYAFRSSGRVRHDKVSGVATIPAGSTGVTVTPGGVNVTSGSFVLLTPRSNIGSRALWYVPHPAQDDFRIRISSSRSSNTKVAWLLLG